MQARWRAELPSPPTTQNEELTRCAAGHVLGPHLDVIGPRGEEHQPIDAQLRVVCGRSSVDVSTRVTEIERVPSVSARSTCSAAARRPAIDRSVSLVGEGEPVPSMAARDGSPERGGSWLSAPVPFRARPGFVAGSMKERQPISVTKVIRYTALVELGPS